MELFVRHNAWLHSKAPKSEKSRYTQFVENGETSPFLTLPSVDYADYIIEYLNQLGYGAPVQGGFIKIAWTEIFNWAKLTGVTLTPWEARLISYLSSVFCDQYILSNGVLTPPPYSTLEFDREKVSNNIKDRLRAIALRRKELNKGPMKTIE